MRQLDLFDIRAEAQVFVFPPARRLDLVRTAVAGLLERDYAGGKRFWLKHTRELTRDLRDAGVKRDEIQRLLTDYARSVRLHLHEANHIARSR